jgi:hypothetical protein
MTNLCPSLGQLVAYEWVKPLCGKNVLGPYLNVPHELTEFISRWYSLHRDGVNVVTEIGELTTHVVVHVVFGAIFRKSILGTILGDLLVEVYESICVQSNVALKVMIPSRRHHANYRFSHAGVVCYL